VPLRADDVSVYESGDDWVRYRLVKKVERKKESFSDKGLKVEEVELLGHDVVEVTDYGAARAVGRHRPDRRVRPAGQAGH
jgi:hypothetical protein